jgi:DNA-binding transcriptional ArsR family regulator
MADLPDILSSKTRAEIFRLLFGVSEKELHIREIERQSKLSFRTIYHELKKLARMDLIKARRSGNRVYYRANDEHPLFNDIRNIVLKTSGLVDVLKEALDHKEIKVAFVFGSVARKDNGARSDVDLMVIGDIDDLKLHRAITKAEEKLGRTVNYSLMNKVEFERQRLEKGGFLDRVISGQKNFIIGKSEDFRKKKHLSHSGPLSAR